MTKIRYIGLKPTKADNVAGTATVWNGQGDVQDVPPSAAPALLKFSAVWELADNESAGAGAESQTDDAPTLDALRAEAVALGIKVPGTWREKRLLEEIAAAKAAGAGAESNA